MVGSKLENLPVYEGEVPESQVISRINKDDLNKVEFYIASHFDQFDYDFKDDKISSDKKRVIEVKIIQAICEVLELLPDDPLVPKYLENILEQLRK
jgi:hypothetical protein